MPELDNLIVEQHRDDTAYQDPQHLGGDRTVPLGKFGDERMHTDDMPVRTGNTDLKDGATPPRGTWRSNRVHPIHRPRTGRECEALSRAFEPFLDQLTFPQKDAVRLVIFGQLSLRQAAEVLGIRHPSVLERLKWAGERLRPAIERRSGSEGAAFPAVRSHDENDTCRVRPRDGRSHKCDGHFALTVCECGTELPRHYNAHTTCRLHSAGKVTRYQFNLAWLIRVGLEASAARRGGQRRPVRGRRDRERRIA